MTKYLKGKYASVFERSTKSVFDEIGISKNKKLFNLLSFTPLGGVGANSK